MDQTELEMVVSDAVCVSMYTHSLVLLGAHLGAGVGHPDSQLLGPLHQGLPATKGRK